MSIIKDIVVGLITDTEPFKNKRTSYYNDNYNNDTRIYVNYDDKNYYDGSEAESHCTISYSFSDDDYEYNYDDSDECFDEPEEEPILDDIVRDNYIYIDSTIIMDGSFSTFVDNIIPLLKKYNKKIYIMETCLNEIRRYVSNKDDNEKFISAQKGMDALEILEANDCLQINKYRGDIYAEANFLVFFMRYRKTMPLFLITHNWDLARDTIRLNTIKAVDGNDISVCTITHYGEIEWFGYNNDDDDDGSPNAEELVKCNSIFIDTSSIMEESFDIFANSIVKFLQKYHKTIVIMNACIVELNRHIGNNDDYEKSRRAKKGLEILNKLDNAGYITVNKSSKGSFADFEYLSYFIKYRRTTPIFFITQDKNLAHDVITLNNIDSVDGYTIEVCKILDDGSLDWIGFVKSYEEYDEEYDEE